MSFQATIIERFQLNPTHAVHCVRCFETTASLTLWVWDPNENPDAPYSSEDAPSKKIAQLLLSPTPRQRRESLEIQCSSVKDRTFLSLDKCLITEGNERCEGLLFESTQTLPALLWIELKMNAKRANPNIQTLEERVIGKAIDQILSTREIFIAKGINVSKHANKAHIAIPKELVKLYVKSQKIKERIVKLRKTVKISAGHILKING